jgi:hypothetical protein
MDDQQDEQPLVALQVTKHNNVEQISSLMVPTEPPSEDDTGHAQAAAPRVNFTSDTNIPQGILRNPYPKTYPSSSKTKRQKPEKVIKKPDYIDMFFQKWATHLRWQAHDYQHVHQLYPHQCHCTKQCWIKHSRTCQFRECRDLLLSIASQLRDTNTHVEELRLQYERDRNQDRAAVAGEALSCAQ